MNLFVIDDTLQIELTRLERALACRFGRRLLVPLRHIVGASAGPAPRGWALRALGTRVPGFVKCGTYYTRAGRDFWLYERAKGPSVLVLELRGERYRRLVLSAGDAREWAERLDPTRPRPAREDIN